MSYDDTAMAQVVGFFLTEDKGAFTCIFSMITVGALTLHGIRAWSIIVLTVYQEYVDLGNRGLHCHIYASNSLHIITVEVDNVFPPDNLRFGSDTNTICVVIYDLYLDA